MTDINYTLFHFLEEHKVISNGENNSFTHTSMGKPTGKYNINDDEYENFCDLYQNELEKQTKLHIVEFHKDVSPILIDLDFSYDLEYSDRLITEKHIYDIVNIYNEEIKNIFDINDIKNQLTAFVFQRDSTYKSKNNIIKDGIHIIYPYIVSEPNVQYYIRENVLKKFSDIIADLPVKNQNHEIIDRDVIYKNGWLLFGSCKPNLDSYQLTYIYDYEMNKIDKCNYHFDNSDNICSFFSIRNKKNNVIIKTDKKHLIDKIISNNEILKKRKNAKNLKNKKHTNVIIDDKFEEIIMNISDEYADDFTTWINVGLALHNIDPDNDEFIEIWKKFSQKSSKYVEGVCEKHWKTMNTLDNGVSIGSLYYWSKESNPKKYNEIRRSSIQFLIDKTINSVNNYDIAKVLYEMNKFNYIYSDNKNWYEFKNHRYFNIKDGAIPLKAKISTDLCDEYQQLISDNNKIITSNDPNISEDVREELSKKNTVLTSICTKLKTTKFKKDIMEECKELFIQYNFEDKLDKNRFLVGFENGIYDLNKQEFRDGTPDDYVTISTKIDYIPFDEIDVDDDDFKEMLSFLRTVFVDNEIRHYFLKVLASCLQGHDAEEKFRIWTGSGCHSKNSLIMMFNGDFKFVQDVEINDLLMGDDYQPRKVLKLNRGFGKMFKINPIIDKPFTVNDEHILCLKNINNDIIEIKVIDYINSNIEFKKEYKYLYLSPINFDGENNIKNPYELGNNLIINNELIKSNHYIRTEFLRGLLNNINVNKIEYYYSIHKQFLNDDINYYIFLIKSLGHYSYINNNYLIIILGLNKLEFTIDYVNRDNFYGFEVDSNHRYLDSNFITHHNSNGKSKLEELFINSFGDYCINFSITLLTRKRAQSNAPTPEIAQAVGKRFAYLEEPSEGEVINAGFMKELTGGSVIKCRGLNQAPIEFKPQFKLHLLCNDIPHVPANDTGVWRRMEIIEFKSKFTDKPNPKNPNEFKIDKQISTKINSWKEYFMSYLIEKYKDYRREGVTPPPEIMKFTLDHQKDCDLYIEFINNRIKPAKGQNICINYLMEDFKVWHSTDIGHTRNMISKKEFKKYLEKKVGKKNIIDDKIQNYVLVSESKNNQVVPVKKNPALMDIIEDSDDESDVEIIEIDEEEDEEITLKNIPIKKNNILSNKKNNTLSNKKNNTILDKKQSVLDHQYFS